MQPNKNAQHGFSLIELAIVLMIIGVLVGSGASVFSVMDKRSKISATKAQFVRIPFVFPTFGDSTSVS